MNLNNMARKQIIKTFITTISNVASEEYRDRVWIEGKGPECDDYDEFINYFLDESEAILKRYKEFGITEDQYNLLKKFEKEIRDFHDLPNKSYFPVVFLKSFEWKKIMEIAKEVLKTFHYKN